MRNFYGVTHDCFQSFSGWKENRLWWRQCSVARLLTDRNDLNRHFINLVSHRFIYTNRRLCHELTRLTSTSESIMDQENDRHSNGFGTKQSLSTRLFLLSIFDRSCSTCCASESIEHQFFFSSYDFKDIILAETLNSSSSRLVDFHRHPPSIWRHCQVHFLHHWFVFTYVIVFSISSPIIIIIVNE